jgi:hypothetical protein
MNSSQKSRQALHTQTGHNLLLLALWFKRSHLLGGKIPEFQARVQAEHII